MGKVAKQVWFKHKDGSLKRIPGLSRIEDLAPKLVQESIQRLTGNGPVEQIVMRVDTDHIVKLTLLDENSIAVKLTPKEEKLADGVKERILARRSAEVDSIIQANEAIRDTLRGYEQRGGIEVIEWDKEVDLDALDDRKDVITELSAIAIADFESRGIEIPAHFKRASVAPADETNPVSIKATPKKAKQD